VLIAGSTSDTEYRRRLEAFEQALADLGWTKGRNIRIDYRFYADDTKLALAFARELVGLAPDVLVGQSTPGLSALQQVTHAIPIVFVQVVDPVGQGFVASLARPGGNVTGFTDYESSLAGKWLEMLKEVALRLARVALVFNPETAPFYPLFLHSLEAAGRSLAVEVTASPVHDDAELERAIAALGREAVGGLVVMTSAFATIHRESIIKLAARYRVPTVYPYRYFAASGGLLSYGVDATDLYRRAASYVDRILKGAKPSDLPVQEPIKFELVINLKTAKALGVTIPPFLLGTADEVIE
jgi:putative tryptophan/tyrosine transport system substrate-binding protein